jgi:outer membrane biosynthesis protein TonB
MVVREKKPDYPAEAMAANIQGTVEMQWVVQTTGVCEDV